RGRGRRRGRRRRGRGSSGGRRGACRGRSLRGRRRVFGRLMRLLRRGDSSSSLDLLVVGLGNPGREYANTRHNVGWLVVDGLARRTGAGFRGKFSGQLAETRLGDARIALLKPETYMNLSGSSVQAAARFFKVDPEHVLVGHEEGEFDLG